MTFEDLCAQQTGELSERLEHGRLVAEATGGSSGRCIDCGDRLPPEMSHHESCWGRAKRIESAANELPESR